MATTKSPRITADMTPAEKKRAVRAMLWELSALLRERRERGEESPWPYADPAAVTAAPTPHAAV